MLCCDGERSPEKHQAGTFATLATAEQNVLRCAFDAKLAIKVETAFPSTVF